MNIEDLMSGIAVVIDDAYSRKNGDDKDTIFELVEKIENEWKVPFYTTHKIPSDEKVCRNLLQSASFILLDWKLWPKNSQELLEQEGIANNIRFLEQAKEYFVPVFIFTNESEDDVIDKLGDLYDKENPGNNFIFIKGKIELASGEFSEPIEAWLQGNASVYTLKTWEQAFYEAKRNLFSTMYDKNPDWPKIFWKCYEDDGVDPSSSMTRLVNDSLLGRIETGIFEEKYLGSEKESPGIDSEHIKSIIEAASFIKGENLPDEIRAGDLFKLPKGKYLLNIRPDCDLISRDGKERDNIELYCIRGTKMRPAEIEKSYERGHFNERVSESIVFSVCGGKTIKFRFEDLQQKKYSEIKGNRVGRLIHPYITRIQQRYALYLQRQGLPRIPEEAITKQKA